MSKPRMSPMPRSDRAWSFLGAAFVLILFAAFVAAVLANPDKQGADCAERIPVESDDD